MSTLNDDLNTAKAENSPSVAAAVAVAMSKDPLMESAAVPEHWNADGSPREGNPLLDAVDEDSIVSTDDTGE